MILKNRVLTAVAAAALLALPALAGPHTTHAAISPSSTSCTGPTVNIYGSSALKSYLINEANAFCSDTTANPNHINVNYIAGGDSCPGLDYAADNPNTENIGASDVFGPACTGSFARASSKVIDNIVAVNSVVAIAQCPGANEPQGGAPAAHTPANPVQCQGNGSGNTFFPAPNDMSVQQAQLLWNGQLSDFAQVGGTGGVAPTLQQRISGSGTRITWCYNVFGGTDSPCTNTAAAGAANTTGTMLNDVCGGFPTGTAPVDPAGTVGYASRAGIDVDPRNTTATVVTPGCGVLALAGHTSYNQNCDPTAGAGQPYQGTNPESSSPTCKGDLEVAVGQYVAWGYEHLFTASTNTSATSPANTFIKYIQGSLAGGSGTAYTNLRNYGFMQQCQMLNTRSADGGAYTPSPAGASC